MKGRLWRWIQIAFLVVSLALAARLIGQQWNELSASMRSIHIDWSLLSAATAVVLLTYAALIQSWRTLVTGWGSKLGFVSATRIWTIGNLGRYIPGKIWSVGALGILAQREGVSPVAAAGSAILGTLLWIGAGFGVVALSGNGATAAMDPRMITASYVCGALFVVGIIALPWILPPVARWIATRLKRPLPDAVLPAKNLWIAVTINALAWVSYGLAFTLFSHAMVHDVQGSLAAFVAVYALSYLTGYLAIFAPGGIFFREGVIILAMSAIGMTSKADATAIALTSRLWLTVLELAPGLLFLLFAPASLRMAFRANKSSPNTAD